MALCVSDPWWFECKIVKVSLGSRFDCCYRLGLETDGGNHAWVGMKRGTYTVLLVILMSKFELIP